MTAAVHAEMHQSHQQSLSETALWRDQIDEWQSELKRMLAELPQIEATLRAHAKALDDHAGQIVADEKEVCAHEASLADYERGGTGEQLIGMARSHDAAGCRHFRQREAHERVRRHHYGFCTKWNLLRKALSEPM